LTSALDGGEWSRKKIKVKWDRKSVIYKPEETSRLSQVIRNALKVMYLLNYLG